MAKACAFLVSASLVQLRPTERKKISINQLNANEMKKVLFLLMLLCPMIASAQDVIVKKDGSTILSKVLEIKTADIKYKKFSNISGPTYTIDKSDILSINYENGETETFTSTTANQNITPNTSNSYTSNEIKKNPASDNEELIKYYRTNITQKGKCSNKNAPYLTAFLGVTSYSVLSNDDIEISFSGPPEGVNSILQKGHSWLWAEFDIYMKNKSDRTIYIDKGNCFRVINNEPYCYYDATEQTTIGRSGERGVSVGLGSIAGAVGVGGVVGQLANGVSVGGASSRSSSTTYVTQRVIAIPPHSSKKLCENKQIEISRNYSKTIDPNEHFYTYNHGNRTDGSWWSWDTYASQFGLFKGDVKLGQVISYDEDNTPYKRIYTITYSKEENFQSFSTICFSLYLQQVIGITAWSEKWKENIDYTGTHLIIACPNAKLQKRETSSNSLFWVQQP